MQESNYSLPDQSDLDSGLPMLQRGGQRPQRSNRPKRPLQEMRFDWYRPGFNKVKLLPTTNENTNLVLVLPGHKDSTLDRRTNWFMMVAFYRIKESHIDETGKERWDMVEIPSLKNWGLDDPIAAVSSYLWRKYKQDPDKKATIKWTLPQFRYVFLTASADDDIQSQQTMPMVLELPGSFRDGRPNEKVSAGYELAAIPDMRENVKASPNYGQRKYGVICNPEDQPIIEVERNGEGLDTQYKPKVLTIRTKLKNREILANLAPIEQVLQKPPLELIYRLLRHKVSEADLREALPAAFEGVDTATTPSQSAPATEVAPTPVASVTVVREQPAPKPVAPAPVAAPAAPATTPTPAPTVTPVAAPVVEAKTETVEAANTTPQKTENATEKVIFKLPKSPAQLMPLIRSLKPAESRLLTDCDKDGTKLYEALVNSGDTERLGLWMPYATTIQA